MRSLLRLEALARKFVTMCASLFPFKKFGDLLYLCNEKIHSMLHSASEIMRWGSLINCRGSLINCSGSLINWRCAGPAIRDIGMK